MDMNIPQWLTEDVEEQMKSNQAVQVIEVRQPDEMES